MLAVSRALSAAGYRVTAASGTYLAAAQRSRACAARLHVTDPRQDEKHFVEQLTDELTRSRYATLIAGSDSALLAISRAREHLAELTNMGLPSHDVVKRCLSRESLACAAEHVGFAPTGSVECATPGHALDAAHELVFPVVVKSGHAATVEGRATPGAPKARIAHNDEELRCALEAFRGEVLLQPWIAGEVRSLGGVIADGRLIGVAASRYLRTWPPDGGSVAFGQSIDAPASLLELTQGLLVEMGWQGMFELEAIEVSPGTFAAIDLNPRPYGSMALASAAGAPLAAIWCDWLLGHDPAPVRARAGRYYRWEDADMRHLVWQLRRGRFAAAARTLEPRRHVAHAFFEIDDPLPAFARALYLLERSARRRWQ